MAPLPAAQGQCTRVLPAGWSVVTSPLLAQLQLPSHTNKWTHRRLSSAFVPSQALMITDHMQRVTTQSWTHVCILQYLNHFTVIRSSKNDWKKRRRGVLYVGAQVEFNSHIYKSY